jgi:hypothetical protein
VQAAADRRDGGRGRRRSCPGQADGQDIQVGKRRYSLGDSPPSTLVAGRTGVASLVLRREIPQSYCGGMNVMPAIAFGKMLGQRMIQLTSA